MSCGPTGAAKKAGRDGVAAAAKPRSRTLVKDITRSAAPPSVERLAREAVMASAGVPEELAGRVAGREPVTSSWSSRPCGDRSPRPPDRFDPCELDASLFPTGAAIRLWRGGAIPPPSRARGRPWGRDPLRPCELPRVHPCALASALQRRSVLLQRHPCISQLYTGSCELLPPGRGGLVQR